MLMVLNDSELQSRAAFFLISMPGRLLRFSGKIEKNNTTQALKISMPSDKWILDLVRLAF